MDDGIWADYGATVGGTKSSRVSNHCNAIMNFSVLVSITIMIMLIIPP